MRIRQAWRFLPDPLTGAAFLTYCPARIRAVLWPHDSLEQLAAKFQIELIVKLGDTLPDMGGLHRKIFVVIKSDLHLHSPFPVLKPL